MGLVWFRYVRDRTKEHFSLGRDASYFLRVQTVSKSSRRGTPWIKLLTDYNLILLTPSYLTVGYFEYIFFFWIYYYFIEIRQMGQSQSAIYTTVLFLTWMVMTPIGGWVSDYLMMHYTQKVSRRIVPVVSLTTSALLLFLGANLNEPTVVAAVLSLALGFASASDASFWASAIDLGGGEVGAACGILNTGGNTGGFIAPTLTPFIASFAGWKWGLYFGSLVVLVGVVIWCFIGVSPRKRNPWLKLACESIRNFCRKWDHLCFRK